MHNMKIFTLKPNISMQINKSKIIEGSTVHCIYE